MSIAQIASAAAVGLASNMDKMQQVAQPVLETGKSTGRVLWRTLWKGAIAEIGLFGVWCFGLVLEMAVFQSYFMSTMPVLMIFGVIGWFVVPLWTLIAQIKTERKRLVQVRKEYDEAMARWQWEQQHYAAQQAEYARFQQWQEQQEQTAALADAIVNAQQQQPSRSQLVEATAEQYNTVTQILPRV